MGYTVNMASGMALGRRNASTTSEFFGRVVSLVLRVLERFSAVAADIVALQRSASVTTDQARAVGGRQCRGAHLVHELLY